MRAARLVITARTMKWARAAALKLTGFATSVIACKCEAAIERELTPDETPDARPGVSVLFFTMDSDSLGKRLTERIGQTVLTCPTASCSRRPARRTRSPARRARAAHLRRPLPDQQGDRGRALLAGAGDGRGVPAAGKLRYAEEGRGRGQLPHPGRGRGQRPGCRRGRGRGDRRNAGRDPSVPWRRRAQRQQGRLARLQGHDCLHQRRLLSDAAARSRRPRCPRA